MLSKTSNDATQLKIPTASICWFDWEEGENCPSMSVDYPDRHRWCCRDYDSIEPSRWRFMYYKSVDKTIQGA